MSDSDSSSGKNDFKSLLVKGAIGAVALAGSTAIPIVVQQSFQPTSTPTASPTATIPAQVSPTPVVPTQVSPTPVTPAQVTPAQVTLEQLTPIDPAVVPSEVQPGDIEQNLGEHLDDERTTTKGKRKRPGK
jgi:hypothetical protein